MDWCSFVVGLRLEVVGIVGYVAGAVVGILSARLPLRNRRKETETGVVALSRWSGLSGEVVCRVCRCRRVGREVVVGHELGVIIIG